MRLRLALAVLALSATAFGAGQTVTAFSVGVIVSKEGTARAAGAAQSLAAIAYTSRLRANGGVFGIPLKVQVVDDAGDPAKALTAAQTLVAQGVDALVCCTVPAVAAQVATWAERTGVVLLSPSSLQGVDAKPYWSFSLAPRDMDALAAVVADAQANGASSIALMTLDNAFGDAALADVRALAKDAGMTFAGVARYPPGATDLTPEGLWIATRQPDAVIVWGLKEDLPVALEGLRRRGYEGPVYGNTALLRAVAGTLDLSGLQGVRFAVAPITVASGLATGDRCADAARTASSRLQSVYSGVLDLPSAAPVYDALDLLTRAFEQVAALHLQGDALTQQRQAVRDSLVGLPPTCGAGGLYDLREGERDAVRPKGLAIAEVEGNRLVAAP